jgi:hypothetical protein
MNYLALANRLRAESAISGNGIATVINQVGEYKKLIDWINMAYVDIQNTHVEWEFLRKDLAFNTIADTQNYVKTGIGLSDFGEWSLDSMRVYLAATGIGQEQYLNPVPWDEFRNAFLFGATRTQTGVPVYIAQKPDRSLILFPIPNDVYTVNGEYFREPHELVLDVDEPLFPSKYHMVIVWRALMMYAVQANAQELFVIGDKESRKLMLKMEQVLLPSPSFSGALA